MIFKTITDETTLSGQKIVGVLQARKIAQQQATAQLEIDIACLKEYQSPYIIDLRKKINTSLDTSNQSDFYKYRCGKKQLKKDLFFYEHISYEYIMKIDPLYT